MTHHDPEILHVFLAEVRSYLPELRRIVAAAPGNAGAEEGYRMLHCVRGAASMLGYGELSEHALGVERRFQELARGARKLDATTTSDFSDRLRGIEALLVKLENELDGVAPLEPEPAAGNEFAETMNGAAAALVDETVPEDILSGFYQEAEEILETLGGAFGRLVADPGDTAALGELRRRVHTLKGTAAMAGFPIVAESSHRLEDDLDRLVAARAPLDPGDVQHLEEAVDHLAHLLAEPPGGGLSSSPESAARQIAPELAPEPTVEPRAGSDAIRVPTDRLDQLVRVASELVIEGSVFERTKRDLSGQLAEMELAVHRLHEIADRLEADFEVAALGGGRPGLPARDLTTIAQPLDQTFDQALNLDIGLDIGQALGPAREEAKLGVEFDELELDRYTEFHVLTRGLAEAADDLGAIGTELDRASSAFESSTGRQARLLRELQEGLLGLRAVPVASLASRLARSARLTARERGKQVELRFSGGDVELDKGLLDELDEMLLHLVRNAVDHGLESPALRRSLGKPERGEVVVTVNSQAGHVVVEVADDGTGIDELAVREAAVERGLVTPRQAAALDRAELLSLVFAPGLSTAREISAISGRGVGLDVVRDAVERLRGAVGLDSTPGAGTRVTLRLPLTLAITRALFFDCRGRTFALPLSTLRRVVRFEPEAMVADAPRPTYRLDGEELPLRRLAEVFELPPAADGTEPERPPLLIVETAVEGPIALVVDRHREAREVVVKPLGPLLPRVEGLAGATLLGDGTVVPILDPGGLRPITPRAASNPAPSEPPEQSRSLDVLIVDDSLSARRVLVNLARVSGWAPLTARDGVEALEILQQLPHPPDLLLLDLEMPRMDGYELTATLRGQPEYVDVPIVVITSRAGAKHRQKAYDLGVSGYLAKPFAPEELVRLVGELTAKEASVSG